MSFQHFVKGVPVLIDEPNDLPNIVKVSVCYGELDELNKVALDEYVRESKAAEVSKAASFTTTDSLNESDERIYFPLSDAKDMRVLELDAGNPDDEINCRLHICSVDFEYPAIRLIDGTYLKRHSDHVLRRIDSQRIWYTALSYVWGDQAVVTSITCNGKPLNVTKNLRLALRHLRHTEVAVVLWIDQLCINQQDLQERAQQVTLMSKIYQHAWSTLVWLGEAADSSNDTIETIKTISATLRHQPSERAPDPEEFERMHLPIPGSAKWSELNSFLCRPWFHRVWIIQEVVLSRNVQFMCGKKCISWWDLSLSADLMVRHDLLQYLTLGQPIKGHASESGCTRIKQISDLKSYHESLAGPPSLLSTLVEGRGAQAFDLRDKVFAIMGMTSIMIYPNYSARVSDVYNEAAQKILVGDPMGLLWCVDHAQPSSGLPSWVPDWSTPRQTTSLGYPGYTGVYQATKVVKIQPQIKDNGRSIVLLGIIFDTISSISLIAASCLQDVPIKSSLTSQFVTSSIQQAKRNCQPNPSDSGLFDAFWQTLVAGKDSTGKSKAPPEFAPIFALLIDSATGSTPSIPDQPKFQRRLTLDNLKVRRPSIVYREMQIAFEAAVQGRRFGTTRKRYMGLLPRGTQVGDQVCLMGGDIPFVVRPQNGRSGGGGGVYQLVGECYIHGIMNGQVAQITDMKLEPIELI